MVHTSRLFNAFRVAFVLVVISPGGARAGRFHLITALYSGNAIFNQNNSPVLRQTINLP